MKPSRLSLHDFALASSFSLLLFAGCTTSRVGTSPSESRQTINESGLSHGNVRAFAKPPPEERPGLATGWGERRDSRVTLTEFHRAEGNTPASTSLLYYNDREGAQAMLAQVGDEPKAASGFQRAPHGFISFGLQNADGAFLEGWTFRGVRHVVGEQGERYAIAIRNETAGRIEVVVSVDGLDVLDGKPASYRKHGYILNPGESYAIEGFRTDFGSVAAFRFSSVSHSYAALRHDNTRNVGVIGVAAFTERNREVTQRREAHPFPRSWARLP